MFTCKVLVEYKGKIVKLRSIYLVNFLLNTREKPSEGDLVNDVLRKRKYFNPQGWKTFAEALREANIPQDLIGQEDRWKYINQTKRTSRSRKRQQSPSPIRQYSPKTPRNRRKEVKNWVDF
jgi:hypothetical protein